MSSARRAPEHFPVELRKGQVVQESTTIFDRMKKGEIVLGTVVSINDPVVTEALCNFLAGMPCDDKHHDFLFAFSKVCKSRVIIYSFLHA